jgi:hypothetical protein
MLPETPPADSLWAFTVAVIYFGSIIAFGAIARMICAHLMERHGAELSDVQEQSGGDPSPRDAYLIGISRKDR